jgi:hypothetical protein
MQLYYLYVNLGRFGLHFHVFAKYGYRLTQFWFHVKSMPFYDKGTTNVTIRLCFVSFRKYWPYGHVAIHIQSINTQKQQLY